MNILKDNGGSMGHFYKPTPHCAPDLIGTTEKESWARMALQYIRVKQSRQPFDTFSAGQIADEMKIHGYPKAPDERVWGVIMQRAKRDGLIRVVNSLGAPV